MGPHLLLPLFGVEMVYVSQMNTISLLVLANA
jgi:hypothetical protein